MTYKTFEDFLQEKHGENYHGTDDDMSDDFDTWLENLTLDDFLEYGNQLINKLKK